MDLAERIEEATAYATLNIGSLEISILYPIANTKGMTTKYGPTVVLSIRESDARIVQLFIPKGYCAVISDDHMDNINTKVVTLNLVYKGLCETSKSFLLGIES